jgi:hypothetical protein
MWVDENDNSTYEGFELWNMTETDPGDTDYTDGKIYTGSRTISYAGDGSLNYRFYASDGMDTASGTPASDSTVTIIPPTVTFTSASQATADETGTAVISCQLSFVIGQDVSVPYTVNGISTATGGGTDYSITASPLTITAGNTTADVTLTITNDDLDEGLETVIIDMGTPTNAIIGSPSTHTVTITDDDTTSPYTPVNIAPSDGAIVVDRRPTLTASSLSGGSGIHQSSQWRISTGTGVNFDANIVYDSGTIADLESHAIASIVAAETTHYWCVRYQDDNNMWSQYSSETSFTTGGPVAQWKLDHEGADNVAIDLTSAYNGTITGATWTTGKSGNALSFGGINPVPVNMGDLDLNGDDVTIEMWIKPGSSQPDYANILSKHAVGFSSFAIEQYLDVTNCFYLGWGDGSSWPNAGTNRARVQLTANVWQHLVFVKSGGTITSYLNGGFHAQVTGLSPTIAPNDLALIIGDWSSHGGRRFNGVLDEIVIYDKVLTGPEVQARYNIHGP